MAISDEDIQKVREANDLVSVFSDRVPVRQRGRDFWCNCPIHEEKSPSCKIDPSTQLWHCFGCHAGGDVFSFIMQADGLDFLDSVRKLAERANITIEETGGARIAKGRKARLKEICKETAAFYHTQLMRGKGPGAQTAREYLARRSFGGDVPKRWMLGFAQGGGQLVGHLKAKGYYDAELVEANVALRDKRGILRDRFYDRVMFPINDVQGECIAFGGRIIGEGNPKYLNSQETPIFHKSEVLYGLDHAKVAMGSSGDAVVVEGYTDVIALHEAGIENAVATLGTALTNQHIRALARHAKHRIVYLFDGDEAGQRAADRALGFIDGSITPEAGRSKIELVAVTLPEGLDPADYVEAHGAQSLKDLMGNAKPLLRYGIERRMAKHDLTRAEGRSAALADALQVLAPIKDSLLAKDYAIQISGMVRMREEDVLAELAKVAPPKAAFKDDGPAYDDEAPQVQGAPARGMQFSQAELNRRRFEREFLSLMARRPDIAIQHADAIAQTQWHEPVHAVLAQSLLDTLAQKPDATAATLVTAAQEKVPSAPSILTSGSMAFDEGDVELAGFLNDELLIGDTDDAIAAMKDQLKRAENMDPQEYEMLFESVVALQKDLAEKRKGHRSVDSPKGGI